MKNKNLYLLLFMCIPSIYNTGCSKKENEPSNGGTIKQGTLYYSAADELIRYDFQSKQEINVFSDGDHYRISPDAKRFTWYKNDFVNGMTRIQIHNLSNPSEYHQVTLPYVLEQTPQFIPGTNNLYVALARAEDGAVKREDLILFGNDDNATTARIPHVKDFAVLPNGHDLVISAEALNTQGEAIGFALAVIKNFRSENEQQSFIIHEYPDYAQLPTNIAVSPNDQQIVFTYSDHLYMVDIKEGTVPKQITQSRFRETNAAWSKDGKYIIFTGNVATQADCGEIRIIPSHPQNPIPIPEDGVNNEPVDPLQPVDTKGKVIHACGSESFIWL